MSHTINTCNTCLGVHWFKRVHCQLLKISSCWKREKKKLPVGVFLSHLCTVSFFIFFFDARRWNCNCYFANIAMLTSPWQ